MDEYSFNDWRLYLAHASKWDWSNGNSSAYNHDYYLRNREKHLARMKELYALKGKVRRLGNKSSAATSSSSDEKSSKKSGGSSKKASTSAATSTSSKIELDENAPEWLKNYAAEIEKVRQSTGNANWVPAHVNDFSAWKAELEKTYPNLNLSGDAAKEVWNTIHSKFGGSSSTSSSSSKKTEDKGEVTKTHTNVTDKTDRKDEEKKDTSSETTVAKEHRLEDLEERAKELEDNKKSVQEEIEEEKKRRRSSSRRETK